MTGLLGTAAVGLYGLAGRVIGMVDKILPQSVLTSLIQPLFYSEYGSARKSSMESGFSILTKLIAFGTFPMTVWVALMSRPIIVYLFEPKYADAAPILAILAINLLIQNFKLPMGLVLLTAERIDFLIYVKVIGVLKILAVLWLVPQGGVTTMAWLAFAATALDGIVVYFLMRWSTKVAGDLWGMLRLVINIALVALIFIPFRSWFDSLYGVILSVPVVAILYLVISYLNKAFTQKERDWMNTHLKRPLWIF